MIDMQLSILSVRDQYLMHGGVTACSVFVCNHFFISLFSSASLLVYSSLESLLDDDWKRLWCSLFCPYSHS